MKFYLKIQVSIESVGKNNFKMFLITADNSNDTLETGVLDILDESISRLSDRCQNAVSETTKIIKEAVSVIWTSPSKDSGCIRLRFKFSFSYWKYWSILSWMCVCFFFVFVSPQGIGVGHSGLVVHGGGLGLDRLSRSKGRGWRSRPRVAQVLRLRRGQVRSGVWGTLVEKHAPKGTINHKVIIYILKITIITKNYILSIQQQDFPSNRWKIQFSDVIGASHTVNYTFWQYNGIASSGLRAVASNGSTRTLESELKDQVSCINELRPGKQ